MGIKLLSQNIIAQLRNFVEAIALKIYSVSHVTEVSYDEKKRALRYIRSRDDLSFLRRFHGSLQVTASHTTMEPDAATRMMWKYLEFMYECKSFVKREFGLDVLHNLSELELINDDNLAEYYRKIAQVLESVPTRRISKSPTDRFYINKKRPFRYGGESYYELTVSNAYGSAQKTDRLIVFTKLNIPDYYSVHLEFVRENIEVIGHSMEIMIVVAFYVSIRPCELNCFCDFLGYKTKCHVL